MNPRNPFIETGNEVEYKELKADARAIDAANIKAAEESVKLKYDAFKHLTTLNTASILLLITFLEKLFSNPRGKFLVAIAFLFFILSTIGSFILMMLLST